MQEYRKLRHTIDQIPLEERVDWSVWNQLSPLPIQTASWPVGDYRPRSEVRLLVHDNALHVRLACHEPDPEMRRAVVRDIGGPVHLDSCLEAFIILGDKPELPYFNFEFNSLGTPHVALGMRRGERRLLAADELEALKITCLIDINPAGEFEKGWWQIHFRIPASWASAETGSDIEFKTGQTLRANFYKCGDLTPDPHYLSWAEIKTPEPDFHRPEFFRTLVIGSDDGNT